MSRGCSPAAVLGLLIAATSLVWSIRALRCTVSVVAAPGLYSTGSVVVVHGFRPVREKFNQEAAAGGISPDQALSPFLLHWQVDSLSLSHKGSPSPSFLLTIFPS